MPAEWEPHGATWIAWPHNPLDWPRRFPAIPWVVADIVRYLARTEIVNIVVEHKVHETSARKILVEANVFKTVPEGSIVFHRWPTDRMWVRDSGATFVVRDSKGRKELGAVCWGFNAWAKYNDWHKDARISAKMASEAKCNKSNTWHPEITIKKKTRRVVLEGGGIEANGAGVVMVTEEWLLSDTQVRNPGIDRAAYEKLFADYLGATQTIWLKHGIVGDDTHGHIDDLARFVGPNYVLLATEDDPKDPNYRLLQQNLKVLRSARDHNGSKFEIIPLPMPSPVIIRGQRVPASYANFYIANNLVLVPTFNDPKDRSALDLLANIFPDRKVVGIHCGDFIWGLGAIHCMTQQQPGIE